MTILTKTPIDLVDDSFIRILAGKGGFGAQLRSLAKQKGAKQTVDFSACRDLNGRRLRHVNNELILKNWKEATERGENFDIEQQTSTGIDLWFLNAPSWAEGIKIDKRHRFLRSRYKSVLCSDWIEARRQHGNNLPPQAASSHHWGCPRGLRCEFAHGEDELRGVGKRVLRDFEEQSRRENLRNAAAEFLLPLDRAAARSDDDYSSLIAEGLLQASKRSRHTSEVEKTITTAADTQTTQATTTIVVNDSKELVHVELLSGSAMAQQEPDNGSLYLKGLSNFCSMIITGSTLAHHVMQRQYYEVTLLSDGLMQIGWCTNQFQGGNDETGEGIGDDENNFSWSYDGMRQLVINTGIETPFLLRTDHAAWEAGDIIGCLVDIHYNNETKKQLLKIAFAVEDRCLQAFQVEYDTDHVLQLIPAISLEKDEEILVNLGNNKGHPFRYNVETLVIETLKGEEDDQAPPPQPVTIQPVEATEVREVFNCIQLDTVSTIAELESFGLDHLKAELSRRGLKVGGSLFERASRLMAVKGLTWDEIDPKLKSKK